MSDTRGAAVPAFASTTGQVLSRSAARSPNRLALTFAGRSWTYAELDRAAGRVAAALLARGLAPGDRVAAFGHNSDAYVLLYLGCAKAGLVHVPVNFNARRDELIYLLTQSEPRIAFVDHSLAEHVDAVGGHLGGLSLGPLHDGAGDDDVLARATDPAGTVHEEDGVRDTDLVQLLYTSGTTSQAKGAMLTHRSLVHEYVSAVVAFELSDRDTPLHSLPLYHSAQLQCFLMPALAVGATNHLLPAPDLDEVFDRVPRDGIDSLFLPPTVWVGVANHPRFGEADLSGLRKAFYGASIMPVPVLQRLQRRLPDVRFFHRFGQSEIGPLATVLRPEEHAARPGSIGRSVLSVQTRVVDRIKDVINTGGVLVASREVEDALYGHDAVAEVAVVGLPHERWIEAIAAVVVPAREVEADELPKNASGKLLKRELRAALGGSASAVGSTGGVVGE